MSSLPRFSLFITVIVIFYSLAVLTTETCESPQYLVLYQRGVVSCDFDEDFFSVLWFNTTNYLENDPILDYQNRIKTGVGYESGEFDVYPNGSLIITRVTLQHEFFIVAYLHTERDAPTFFPIQVVVLDKPDIPYPVINLCGNESKHCYSKIDSSSVKCSVSEVRHEVIVNLYARTTGGDKNISSELSFTSDSVGYTSSVTSADVFHYASHLVLLVCKASSPQGVLKSQETILLVQKNDSGSIHDNVTVRYFERNTTLELNCTDKNVGFIVWKKMATGSTFKSEMLLWSVFIGKMVTEINAEDVSVDGQGALVIPRSDVKHEGRYVCTYGNGLSDGTVSYDVTVFVPAYPVIEGCNHFQYCKLRGEYEGTLTCAVKGIRPQVQLRWETFSEDGESVIVFQKQQLMVKENGDTFDVTLVSGYLVTDKTHDKVTVWCKVVASQEQLLGLSVKVDLFFEEGNSALKNSTEKRLFWIIPVFVAVLLLASFAFGYYFAIRFKPTKSTKSTRQGQGDNVDEMTSMRHRSLMYCNGFQEKKHLFLKEILETYAEMYSGVQPIPYLRDRLLCVNQVFIDSGLEYLTKGDGSNAGNCTWIKLTSYNSIFTDPRLSQAMVFLLYGEPGYGKSTLALQYVYDWCNHCSGSPLKDVEMLIFLRLRYVRGGMPIAKAIKEFLLPSDTTLNEHDVIDIIKSYKSLLLVFDGLDEYSDSDFNGKDDVTKIITRQMFRDFKLVVTTRPSGTPPKRSYATQHLRLTGFDDQAKEKYILKAVVDGNTELARGILRRLQQNPILADICQVSLFFVMFAHMAYESPSFLALDSVTSFFRYVIACFYEHIHIKAGTRSTAMKGASIKEHQKLDKVAFESLQGNDRHLVWNREQLVELIDETLYSELVEIGILVEENVVRIVDEPGTSAADLIQWSRDVSFYHKLFCEWYAAHYVAEHVKDLAPDVVPKFFAKMDPFDLQYVYRIACGLNSAAADIVIKYLHSIEGGDKFAILCILEQTGQVDKIIDNIQQICLEGVVISGYDSLLLQRSSMQLLEIAARNQMPINFVGFHDCFQSVDPSEANVWTTSGYVLTSMVPIKELLFSFFVREMTEDEYIAILEFALKCPWLRILGFLGSPPPRYFEVEPTLSHLYWNNVTVNYLDVFESSAEYILNHFTGHWETKKGGFECTDEDFQRMKTHWDEREVRSDEVNKRDLQEFREDLRRFAEEELSGAGLDAFLPK